MGHFSRLPQPLNSVFQTGQRSISQMGLIFLGVFGIALAAQVSVRVPFQAVPLCLQSAAVLLVGLVYGPRLGTKTIMGYLLAGAAGFPVFAEMSGGLHVFAGPTGGYLLGYLPAVLLTGYLSQRGFAKNPGYAFLAAILGAFVIFSFGFIFLSAFVGFKSAYFLGVKPFWVTECVKLIAVSCLAPYFWKREQ